MEGAISVAGMLMLAAAAFTGALVQAATGFGFAIVAAPVFLAVLNTTSAVPLLVALHVVQTPLLVPSVYRQASAWHLKRLMVGTVVGCPLGLWLIARADVRTLQLVIGCVILSVIALLFCREWLSTRSTRGNGPGHSSAATAATGAVAGAMTAMLVMPGPALMIYFMSEQRLAAATRALSITYFAILYVVVMLANLALGRMSMRDWALIGLLAPGVVAGTLAGARIAGQLSEGVFRGAVLTLLLAAGLGAIASALLA